MTSDLHWLTATAAARAIARKELSPVELTQALLDRTQRLDPLLNVFVRLDGDAALKAARVAESEAAAGQLRGPLHGVRGCGLQGAGRVGLSENPLELDADVECEPELVDLFPGRCTG